MSKHPIKRGSNPMSTSVINEQVYCWQCGKQHAAAAVICVGCGCETYFASEKSKENSSNTKSKTISVVLAVFISYWSFLYTFQKDWWKFLIAILCDIWFGLAYVIVAVNSYSEEPVVIAFLAFVLIRFLCWLGSVLLSSCRSQHWYENYRATGS